jgi:hypothetical protein
MPMCPLDMDQKMFKKYQREDIKNKNLVYQKIPACTRQLTLPGAKP